MEKQLPIPGDYWHLFISFKLLYGISDLLIAQFLFLVINRAIWLLLIPALSLNINFKLINCFVAQNKE